MTTIVQKYGGTSVADVERIQAVAERVARAWREAGRVVVVVSAMAGETNRLTDLARVIHPSPPPREVDVLLSSGEQVSASLLAIALEGLGVPAVSLMGHQAHIMTDRAYGQARIRTIEAETLRGHLDDGEVCVVAGFQGLTEAGDITTLGRGGSDTSAVAVAAALRADCCEIYTDVPGVFTADPRLCPDARKLDRIRAEEMLEMASLGAKVLQVRAVEFAHKWGVRVHVRSSFSEEEGTIVEPSDTEMEGPVFSGAALVREVARITIPRIPPEPGIAAAVFQAVADAGVNVDVIVQDISAADRCTALSFTLSETDLQTALDATRGALASHGLTAEGVAGLAKVSVVGIGMRSQHGVAATMFQALAARGIDIQMISTSEIKISCVVAAAHGEEALRACHAAFELAHGKVT